MQQAEAALITGKRKWLQNRKTKLRAIPQKDIVNCLPGSSERGKQSHHGELRVRSQKHGRESGDTLAEWAAFDQAEMQKMMLHLPSS